MNLNARSAFLIGFAGSMSLGLMPVASAAPSATLSDGLRAALTHVSVDTKGLAP